MLYINREQYAWDAHLFGDKPDDNSHRRPDQTVLNETYRIGYERFAKLHKFHGPAFESVEISGKKLVGYLSCPHWAFTTETPYYQDSSLVDLVIAYVRLKVELPFEKWIAQNPLIRPSRHRTRMSLFHTHEGELYLAYLHEGKLCWELIDKPCFIHNGFVTSVEEALEKQRTALVDQLARLDETHEKIRSKPWDLVKKFDRNPLLNFVRSH